VLCLQGVLLIGCSVTESSFLVSGRFVLGHFVSGSSFLDIVLVTCGAFCSLIFVPGVADTGSPRSLR
jgi:hypothetical protein